MTLSLCWKFSRLAFPKSSVGEIIYHCITESLCLFKIYKWIWVTPALYFPLKSLVPVVKLEHIVLPIYITHKSFLNLDHCLSWNKRATTREGQLFPPAALKASNSHLLCIAEGAANEFLIASAFLGSKIKMTGQRKKKALYL